VLFLVVLDVSDGSPFGECSGLVARGRSAWTLSNRALCGRCATRIVSGITGVAIPRGQAGSQSAPGDFDAAGELGLGTTTWRLTPVAVVGERF
jgi:hypothetical protein